MKPRINQDGQQGDNPARSLPFRIFLRWFLYPCLFPCKTINRFISLLTKLLGLSPDIPKGSLSQEEVVMIRRKSLIISALMAIGVSLTAITYVGAHSPPESLEYFGHKTTVQQQWLCGYHCWGHSHSHAELYGNGYQCRCCDQ